MIFWEVYSTRLNENNLRSLAVGAHSVSVLRNKNIQNISVKDLVVGDAVVLNSGKPSEEGTLNCLVGCDMILVQGLSVLVDESSLTGESIPVVKSSLSTVETRQEELSMERHKKYLLYCGSKILSYKKPKNSSTQTSEFNNNLDFLLKDSAIGIVVSTGFSSTKGNLFRSILYPNEIEFKFYQDAYKFLFMLSIVALIAFINNLAQGLKNKTPILEILVQSFDLITIAVPPALPLVLTVGIGFSLTRLKKKKIFCIDPERINFAGSVDLMCWDKTGTLTTSALSWIGSLYSVEGKFRLFESKVTREDIETLLFQCLSTCHGINVVNNVNIGHSVDVEMLKASGWQFSQKEPYFITPSGEKISVIGESFIPTDDSTKNYLKTIKRFDFEAQVQRHSVVCANFIENKVILFSKGSPESIRNICDPSTVPEDFISKLNHYASKGFYVLACACKILSEKTDSLSQLDIDSIKRENVEYKLVFLGFFILENPLKKESRDTIKELSSAAIRSVIITGDNSLTAVHVAKELKLCSSVVVIDLNRHGEVVFTASKNIENAEYFPLENLSEYLNTSSDQIDIAMSGAALQSIQELHNKTFVNWLICRTRIFSRAKPDQKTWIVEALIGNGFCVGMCGDGTNDCGALKAANVGLALSDTEASMIAPFTSASKSISDIPILLREGRCALETSFVAFKYMTLYPIIQLTMSATLYGFETSLSNNQFLFDDLFLVLFSALLMCLTEPIEKLSKTQPILNLVNIQILSSILGQVVIYIIFFYMQTAILFGQSWFCSAKRAVSGLDDATMLPLNSSAPVTTIYPCYPINIEADTTPEFHVLVMKQQQHGCFLILVISLAFSIWSSHRKPFWTNTGYLLFLIVAATLLSWLFFIGEERTFVASQVKFVLSLREVSADYRIWLFVLAIINSVFSICWEIFIIKKLLFPWNQLKEERKKIKKAVKRAKEAGVLATTVFFDNKEVSAVANGLGIVRSTSVISSFDALHLIDHDDQYSCDKSVEKHFTF
ncbi:hypothetical protein HDU92_002678 [Lobulomyces angularis]|nr:hypothetical protein HDU92_002678 [Lobulomyces angularis]